MRCCSRLFLLSTALVSSACGEEKEEPKTSYDCSAPSGETPLLKLTEIANGFDHPLGLEFAPGDSERLFIVERNGKIKILKDGATLAIPFLDLSTKTTEFEEQGLLGLAFHPQFASNGKFYVHYTANGATAPPWDTVISAFSVLPNNPDVADPSSEEIVFTLHQPFANHNGGQIRFHKGRFWIGLGDGGSGGDPMGYAQSLSTLLGKMLRIDLDRPQDGKSYRIPDGNMSGPGVAPEIWSYGWRNPWRFSFDVCTNDLYIADVGQATIEEINVEPAKKGSGTNYGWNVLEGSKCFQPPTGCDTTGKTMPAAEYDHSLGLVVIGGFVYRGSAIPGLRGTYIYADYSSGRFWTFRWNGTRAENLKDITATINPADTARLVSTFGQDEEGEIYVASLFGPIYRIEAQ